MFKFEEEKFKYEEYINIIFYYNLNYFINIIF